MKNTLYTLTALRAALLSKLLAGEARVDQMDGVDMGKKS